MMTEDEHHAAVVTAFERGWQVGYTAASGKGYRYPVKWPPQGNPKKTRLMEELKHTASHLDTLGSLVERSIEQEEEARIINREILLTVGDQDART